MIPSLNHEVLASSYRGRALELDTKYLLSAVDEAVLLWHGQQIDLCILLHSSKQDLDFLLAAGKSNVSSTSQNGRWQCFQLFGSQIKSGFGWMIGIGNQPSKDIGQEIPWTPVARMLNLADVLELVID